MLKQIFALFFILVVVFSCTENTVDTSSDNENLQPLGKLTTFNSPEYNWTTGIRTHPYYGNYISSTDDYAFSFRSFQYSLHRYVGGWGIEVSVNGNNLTTVDYYNQYYVNLNSSYSTGWFPFNYNGIDMKISFYILHFSLWNTTTGRYDHKFEPRKVFVQTIERTIDPPLNFKVLPAVHNNLNQAITVSWTPSTDVDVTGYKIYRKYQGQQYFSMIQQIGSRTTANWIDYTVPWSLANPEVSVADYKIVSIGTNLVSEYSIVKSSRMP